jgi:nitroreductase
MNFLELAKKRYSCRKYRNQKVEDEKLNLVLEAGRIAPSAVNYQPWIFIVVKSGNIDNIRGCYHREWFASAPLYIVLCANHVQSWKRKEGKDHADLDAAIAADHMTLAATDIGVATWWVCNFDKEKLTKTLNLPAHFEPVVILPLGYPDDQPDENRHETKRKKMQEILFTETYKAS